VKDLASVVIEIGDLRSKHSDEVEELEKFLKERIKASVDVADRELTLKPEAKGQIPSKGYLRVLLKKYLHKADLREEFRVIAGKENRLVIKERKEAREE
jgi:hypothetical protein